MQYHKFLKEKKTVNEQTIRSYFSGLRVFLYYCMREGYIENFKIVLPKAAKVIKATYTDEELKQLLKKPNIKACGFPEYRNWVMSNYLISTGNRLGTIRELKISDLDLNDLRIHLREMKNNEQQIIPLSKSITIILKEYLIYRKQFPRRLFIL